MMLTCSSTPWLTLSLVYSRFRNQLCNMIARQGRQFDDFHISPVIRQTLQVRKFVYTEKRGLALELHGLYVIVFLELIPIHAYLRLTALGVRPNERGFQEAQGQGVQVRWQ